MISTTVTMHNGLIHRRLIVLIIDRRTGSIIRIGNESMTRNQSTERSPSILCSFIIVSTQAVTSTVDPPPPTHTHKKKSLTTHRCNFFLERVLFMPTESSTYFLKVIFSGHCTLGLYFSSHLFDK